MTQQPALTQRAIRWSRIAAISAGIFACVSLIALLWPQPQQLPMPPRVVEPPLPFVASADFEAANDLAVLRVVLEKSCQAGSPEILSSRPEGTLGNRSSYKPSRFPEGLACAGVRIVDSQEIDALFKKPYRGKRDFKHQGGWGNFYNAYPDATGLLSLSLPSYPSPTSAIVSLGRTCGYLCGAGWKISLLKLNGKWVIREQQPSWIS